MKQLKSNQVVESARPLAPEDRPSKVAQSNHAQLEVLRAGTVVKRRDVDLGRATEGASIRLPSGSSIRVRLNESKEAEGYVVRLVPPSASAAAASPRPTREGRAAWVAPTRWSILAATGVLLLVTLLIGSNPTRVVGLLIAATTIQGVLLGGRTILAVVLGLVSATIIGMPVGRALGSNVGSLLGQSGLIGYGVGLLAVVAVTLLIAAVICRLLIGRVTSKLGEAREQLLRDVDVPAGAVLGFIQGSALALLVIWGIDAIRPIAVFQAEQAREPGAVPNPAAERFVALTEGFESSAPGALAAATNPIADLTVFDVANDFIVVMGNPEAREQFESDPLFDEISSLPSVTRALEIIKTDPLVGQAIEDEEMGRLASDLLRSDAVVQALRETSVVDDLTPYVDRIQQALRSARAMVD